MDLLGLGDSVFRHKPSSLKHAIALYAFIKDPSGLLQTFCRNLRQEFVEAGLGREDPREIRLMDHEFCQIRVIDTKGLSSGIPNNKPTLKHLKKDMLPRFDARDMCVKFKDIVWGKSIHLDRVCIGEFNPQEIFEDGEKVGYRYHDIASVPLPGVTWEPRPFEYLRLPHGHAASGSRWRNGA